MSNKVLGTDSLVTIREWVKAKDEAVKTELQAQIGSPLVASTAAAMTDHTKVYVYTGSETGYTAGNWYYYNGSAWTSGGVYNSTALQTDTTLSVSGMAADAKKTGDEITGLKTDINECEDELGLNMSWTIPEGYQSASFENAAHTRAFKYENNRLIIKKADGSTGEISTTNAGLTIGSSLAYEVTEGSISKLKFEYENTVEENNAFLVLRFYDSSFSNNRNANVTIPTGTGSFEVDLVEHATSYSIPLSTYKNLIIRSVSIEAIGNTTVQIYGIANGFTLKEQVEKKYEKPPAGIPASDLASGVIPDVTGKVNTSDFYASNLPMSATNTRKTETEIESTRTESDNLVEEVGGIRVRSHSIPSGYQSASYENAAHTRAFKYENGKLIIKKADATTGEISTTTAGLTIGSSLGYDLSDNKFSGLRYEYENTVTPNTATMALRYYNSDYSYANTININVPLGSGTEFIDLLGLAKSNNVNLSIYKNLVIRAIAFTHNENASETESLTVWIDGITNTPTLRQEIDNIGDGLEGIGDSIETLSETVDDISEDLQDVSKIVAAISTNLYVLRKQLPSYYISIPTSPSSFSDSSNLDAAIARVPEGKSVIFVTDTHWESNKKNTFELIQYVKSKLKINKVLFGGDCIDRGDDKYKGLNIIRDFMYRGIDAFGTDFLVTIGNHDNNMGHVIEDNLNRETYRIPYDQLFNVYISHLDGTAEFEDLSSEIDSVAQSDADKNELIGWSKLHYYVDDSIDKIRYISIFSSVPDDVFITSYTGFPNDGGGGPSTVMQYEWFANTLMSTPSGYDIIVIAHCADSEGTTSPARQKLRNYFDFFTRIASAFHKKCTGYKINVANFDACPTNAFWTKETKQWDFSNAPNVGKIIFLAGHMHRNIEYVTRITTDSASNPTYERGQARNNGNPALVGTVQEVEVFDSATVDYASGEIVTIITNCDAYLRVNHNNKYQYEMPEMTENTVTDQSFDVVTLTDNAIVCTRFGAGWDRTIPVRWVATE